MAASVFPVLVVINHEGFYVASRKDLEDGVFDNLQFSEEKLARVAELGNYAQEVYGTDEKFCDDEIKKAITRDFVGWLADMIDSGSPSDLVTAIKDLDMPGRFIPLLGHASYVETLHAPYKWDEEVGYKTRRGLHLTGIKLADLINDRLCEDRLIQSIEQCIDEREIKDPSCRRDFCSTVHFLHFTDGVSALNACAVLKGNPTAREKLTEEMNLSIEKLGLLKGMTLEGCTIGSDGRVMEDVQEHCPYPALVSIDGDAVFLACDEDIDVASDVFLSNVDEDEMVRVFGPECEDRTYGHRYDEELQERIGDYLNDALIELSCALGFAGETKTGKPNGEYETEVVDYKINRVLGISKEYDAALPIVGLWQPAELAFTPKTWLYFIDSKGREMELPLDGFIAHYVTDEEINKVAERFHKTHADIPARKKFASVTMDLHSGIDALNMLTLLYGSREIATLALVDAAAKRGITITGVAFR